jgi:hypothetical protein
MLEGNFVLDIRSDMSALLKEIRTMIDILENVKQEADKVKSRLESACDVLSQAEKEEE